MAQLLSDAVNVTARTSPEGARRREFGATLYLHEALAVVTAQKEAEFIRETRLYASAQALADDGVPDAVETAGDNLSLIHI